MRRVGYGDVCTVKRETKTHEAQRNEGHLKKM